MVSRQLQSPPSPTPLFFLFNFKASTSPHTDGRETHPRHAPIDHEVGPVHEAALVAGEEEHGLGLLDGLAEAAGREVDLAAVPLGRVVAEPVLQEGRAVKRGEVVSSGEREREKRGGKGRGNGWDLTLEERDIAH